MKDFIYVTEGILHPDEIFLRHNSEFSASSYNDKLY